MYVHVSNKWHFIAKPLLFVSYAFAKVVYISLLLTYSYLEKCRSIMYETLTLPLGRLTQNLPVYFSTRESIAHTISITS